jgi:hypothetical protein
MDNAMRLMQILRAPLLCGVILFSQFAAVAQPMTDDNPLALPPVGAFQLRIIASNLLELTRITTKAPLPAKVNEWDFVNAAGQGQVPNASEFVVSVAGTKIDVQKVGFKRRVLYAPLAKRDLRIGNHLYLQLSSPIAQGQNVEVNNPSAKLWSSDVRFMATMDPSRYSPAIHVNEVGYVPEFSKKAMVGFFLGSLGELQIPADATFQLVDVRTGADVFQAKLIPRRDVGFEYGPYQKVFEANFSDFKKPGEYRLVVSGLGASFPFFIDDGVAAAFARTYALGLYHQRCGTSNSFPFTRFLHGPCHTAPAQVPTMTEFTNTMRFLAVESAKATNNPRHTAPRLKDFNSSLYPFVKRGQLDVSSGHHDAGDYSKYTINSAALIHTLVSAVDALPGVGELDNLGLPESGDGKSDLLQEAKWEADFLAKMQDDDGGFYFLVYPQSRRYESNVLPDQGDPQIVWPKNTAVTAAAVAALAQASSSPILKKQFPETAAAYLDKAKKGWAFLDRALAKHGGDGAYQKITHYGDDFLHDDELAWAACEMFLATGDELFHKKMLRSFQPGDDRTRRWGWWRLYEGYGRAIRSYALAVRSGKADSKKFDRLFLQSCQAEITAAADDQQRWSQQSAYGTSFPTETKRHRGGGWYFSLDQAFDLAIACGLDYPVMNDPRPKYREAILGNLNFEGGCNPINVTYVTGLGWRRQREIVHQFAQNDRRVLPPSGIPIGNVQSGFGWLDFYREELGTLSFPWDGAKEDPYPLYDRWGDSFNLQTEFVVVNQARALATAAWLMVQTPLKNQPWKSAPATIDFTTSGNTRVARLKTTLDLSQARICWEAADHEPVLGSQIILTNATSWVEAEAQWPDGRRVFARTLSLDQQATIRTER